MLNICALVTSLKMVGSASLAHMNSSLRGADIIMTTFNCKLLINFAVEKKGFSAVVCHLVIRVVFPFVHSFDLKFSSYV